uniref:Ubiquitin-conjugating enzyme E2 Z n=1 Tax=viral metagenome TaxID=1070528 RepID=A0A6C0KZX0_9ZZZZ|tara:strand:- start:1063 stop:1779 length:717 start_codon:yes stop_codon:yes gene_type:complete
MSSNALKRILTKDIKEITNKELSSLGIYIHFDEEDMFQAKAMVVGPKDSLYEGGFLFFSITFPKNYPFSPPDVSYISRNNIRIHPNLYVGGHSKTGFGKVCLSILGTWSGPRWTSIMDITTVLLCIQSLLDKNPLHHEPGHEKNNTPTNTYYNQVIQYESLNTLFIKNFTDIPQGYTLFYNDMRFEIQKNKDSTLLLLEQLSKQKPCRVEVPLYRISHYIDYEQLSINIKDLFQREGF